jgi:hypothetical protein
MKEAFMKEISPLLLLAASLCWVGPTDASAQNREFSARHRVVVAGPSDVVVFRPGCRPGFTVAPTRFKTFDDRRWPYVSWRGSCDSLYAPGPMVTFVTNQWY